MTKIKTKKSLKKSRRNREYNLKFKREIKNALKTKKKEAVSLLDKAVKKKVIHKNKAARIKSRLAKKKATKR